MTILIDDVLKYSTIVNAGGIVTANGHPIEYVLDPRLSRAAWIVPEGLSGALYGVSMYHQTPYLNLYAINDIIIDFDIGGSVPFDLFSLGGNNWNNIGLELSWSETDIEIPDGSIMYSSVTPEYVVTVPLGAQVARYFRVRIHGVTTNGNYVSVGKISLGTAQALPKISTSLELSYISNATRTLSDSRQLYGGPKTIYRQVTVNFPEVNDPSVVLEWFRKIDIYNPFFVSIDEECLAEPKDLYGALVENTIPFTYNAAGFYTGRIIISEVF